MSKDHASSYEASRQKPPNVIKLVGLEQFFKSLDRDVRPVGRETPGAEAAVAARGSGTRVGTAREAAAAGRAAAAAAVAKTTTVTSGMAAAASGPRDQLLAGGGADTAAAASKGPAIGLGTAGASAGAAAGTGGGYGGDGSRGERDGGAPWDDADAAGSRTKRRRKDTDGSGGSGDGCSPLGASYVSGSPAAACAATGTRRGAESSMLTPLALHPSKWQPGSLPMSNLPSNTFFWEKQDGTLTYPGNQAGLEPATQRVASQGTGPKGAKCALWALGGGVDLLAGVRSGAQKRLGRFGGGGGGPGSGGRMTGPGGDAARADEVPDGRDATGADARWSGYEDDELMYWFQDPVDDCDGVDTHMRWDDAPGRGRAGALGLDRWGEGGALHTRTGMPTPGGAAAKAGEASPGSDQSTLTIEAIGEFATMSAVDAAGMWRFEIEEAARKLWPLKGAPPRVAWCQPGVAHPPLRRYYRTQKVRRRCFGRLVTTCAVRVARSPALPHSLLHCTAFLPCLTLPCLTLCCTAPPPFPASPFAAPHCLPSLLHPANPCTPLLAWLHPQVLWRSDERTHEATVAKIDHRSVPPLYTLDLSRSYSFETKADSTAHAMLLCLQPFDKVWVRLRLPQQQQQQQRRPGSAPGGAGGFNGEAVAVSGGAEAVSGGAEGLQAHAGEPGSGSNGGRAGSESGSEGTKDLAAGAEAARCAATAAAEPGFSPNLVWEEAWVVGVDASYPDPEVWLLTACPMERSVLWPYLPPAMRAAAGSGNSPGGSVEVDLDEEGAYGAVGQVEQEGQDPDCIVVGMRRGGRGSGGQAPLALCVRMSDIDLRHAVGECSSAAPGIGGRGG